MNKQEIITAMSEKMGATKKDAELALKAFTETIVEGLQNGEKIQLVGFGTFSVADVAERTGTVQLGENKGSQYVTPAHKAPKFKFGKNVKDLVKGQE